ncbi:MAG: hypothetical protein QF502_10855 [Nitrospinaceae bacterium]|nr:hypothetical protein [Nitrospinaceae bacterium]
MMMPKTIRYYIFLIFGLIAILFVLKFFFAEHFSYTIWSDRDLIRASELDRVFQVSGAELYKKSGARVPGGAMYYFLFLLMKVNESPLFLYIVFFTVWVLGMGMITHKSWEISGPFAGVVTASAFLSSSLNQITAQLWNPLFGLSLAIFGYFFSIRLIETHRPKYFIVAISFFCIAAQMHLSYLAVLLALIITITIIPCGVRFKHIGYALFFNMILYSPWLLHNIFGFFGTVPIILIEETSKTPYDFIQFAKYTVVKSIANFSFNEPQQILLRLPFFSIAPVIISLILAGISKQKLNREYALERNIIIALLIFVSIWLLIIGITFTFWEEKYPAIGFHTNRYYVCIAPLIAFICGISLSSLIKYLALHQKKYVSLLIYVILIFASLKILMVGYNYVTFVKYRSRFEPFDTYTTKLEMLEDVKQTFGFDRQELIERVSIVFRYSSDAPQWYLRDTPSQYLLNQLDFKNNTDRNFNGCVFVVTTGELPIKPFSETDRGNIEKLAEQITGTEGITMVNSGSSINVQNVELEKLIHRENYSLFAVRLPTGGCPKSLTNDYSFFDTDKWILSNLPKQPDKAVEVKCDQKTTCFIIKHKIENSIFPIDIMVSIHNRGNELNIVFHSKKMRNSTQVYGYWAQAYIISPKLVLTNNDTGKRIEHLLFDGVLGGGRSFKTPWTAAPLKILPGEYTILLEFGPIGINYNLSDNMEASYPNTKIPLTFHYKVS